MAGGVAVGADAGLAARGGGNGATPPPMATIEPRDAPGQPCKEASSRRGRRPAQSWKAARGRWSTSKVRYEQDEDPRESPVVLGGIERYLLAGINADSIMASPHGQKEKT